MKLVTAQQMHDIEQRCVDARVSLDDLMEAAGLAVAQEAWLSLGVVAGRRILVLCGPGNNGGDGLVAARHLADWEADVVVYLLAPRDDVNLTKVRALGVPVFVASDDGNSAALDNALTGAELIVDALLGTGRSRPIDGALANVLERLQGAKARPNAAGVIAVDLPTGIDADTGAADPLAVHASTTLTFGFAKVGLYALPGSEYAGNVQVIDIGIPASAVGDEPLVELLSASWVRERLPARPPGANKGTFGRVLVVAGSGEYVGAPRLAAEAAYRVGAGLVTVASPAHPRATIAPALPEATYISLEPADALGLDAARIIVERLTAFDVLLIGPGLSQATGVRESVTHILTHIPQSVRACVIDADALNALAATPDWHKTLHIPCVLTPHPGEMARLTARSVADVQAARLDIARTAAADWGQVVVLKGAHTIVATPEGATFLSPHANPLLATAGTGDVLAGAIAGLLAQGMEPGAAAAAAVFIHALAATEAGENFGDRGLLASDLLPALPKAIRTVREGKRAPATSGDSLQNLAAMFGAGTDNARI
ncbi:MAG TPA: NAD(P)H-hydrate dehydratase [Dehalococcoidia bacterium]